jgi:hydroxymethylbilane synthase
VRLRLGTRGSALALWQARHVAERLGAAWPALAIELAIMSTKGDQRPDIPLASSSADGVFVREIEDALLAGSVDLAVHSLKDLPTATPAGLKLAAFPARHDPRDALVCKSATRVADLPTGAVVATGSPRRRSQLAHERPDLEFAAIRGNVDTRLAKLDRGEYDALILAVAGIERLGRTDAPYAPIPLSICLPAPGQGALAVEIRADDAATLRLVSVLDDAPTAAAVTAERAFLACLGAGCLAPAGAIATTTGERLTLEGMVGSLDGKEALRDRIEGARSDAVALGESLARRLLASGGAAILAAARP